MRVRREFYGGLNRGLTEHARTGSRTDKARSGSPAGAFRYGDHDSVGHLRDHHPVPRWHLTVAVNGNLARIEGHDADALGKQPLESSFETPEDGTVNENQVWEALRNCYDP